MLRMKRLWLSLALAVTLSVVAAVSAGLTAASAGTSALAGPPTQLMAAFALVDPNGACPSSSPTCGSPGLVAAHTRGFVSVTVGPFGPGEFERVWCGGRPLPDRRSTLRRQPARGEDLRQHACAHEPDRLHGDRAVAGRLCRGAAAWPPLSELPTRGVYGQTIVGADTLKLSKAARVSFCCQSPAVANTCRPIITWPAACAAYSSTHLSPAR